MNMASQGDTMVENNKLSASRERSLRNIQRIAKKNMESKTTHCETSIAISIISSMRNTSSKTPENPVNLLEKYNKFEYISIA